MATNADSKLIFVYNADSGLFNTVTDIAHKAFSPQTYQCQLCQISHGVFRVRKEWTMFIESLGIDCEFLHRDELQKQYGVVDVELPAIYRWRNGDVHVCADADAINHCVDMEQLKALIRQKCLDTA
jgi:hypothetical protein